MSGRNVEIGKRLNDAFNRGDIEAALAFFSPEAELRDLLTAPGQDSMVHGTDRIREVLFLWTSVFERGTILRTTLGFRSKQEALAAAGAAG